MLTRLKVHGFKNLAAVDVRFGPLTCITGPNGAGKSNLFDAIAFLSALADRPLYDAALSIRGASAADSLFRRRGDTIESVMSFEAEMIVPSSGTDDLGQPAEAATTFLRYTLQLACRRSAAPPGGPRIEILAEDLSHIRVGDAHKHLLFPHSASAWRRSVVTGHAGGHRTAPFLSTEGEGETRVIRIHQDGETTSKSRTVRAAHLPRTVLSTASAVEGPTASLARAEMRSWRVLQLESSALRRSSPLSPSATLAPDGAHLAAAVHRLAAEGPQLAARLSELIGPVQSLEVDRDDVHDALTLWLTGADGARHRASALSGGALRFLALAVLELDPLAAGLLCIEEPEVSIHPDGIPALLQLLRRLAADPTRPAGPGNPLRQLIAITHSPALIAGMNDEDLLHVSLQPDVTFACLPGTWRDENAVTPSVPRSALTPRPEPPPPPDPQTAFLFSEP